MISSVGRISRVAMTCRPNVSLFSTLNGRQTEPSSKCLDMQYSEQTGILQYWHCSEVAVEHRKHGAVMMPPSLRLRYNYNTTSVCCATFSWVIFILHMYYYYSSITTGVYPTEIMEIRKAKFTSCLKSLMNTFKITE